jgi:hypothetical protein
LDGVAEKASVYGRLRAVCAGVDEEVARRKLSTCGANTKLDCNSGGMVIVDEDDEVVVDGD